jgi:hypothetical protein
MHPLITITTILNIEKCDLKNFAIQENNVINHKTQNLQNDNFPTSLYSMMMNELEYQNSMKIK